MARGRLRLTILAAAALGVNLLPAPAPPGGPRPARAAEPLVVAVGGPAEEPAYLPVHAAAALGVFAAEGVAVTLRRSRHPTAALAALRDREADVAATTLDQAIRGAWARGTPVRILVAHTRAAEAALVASRAAGEPVRGLADLRGKRLGSPGPGTTGAYLLGAVLRGQRIEPWQVEHRGLGGQALVAGLRAGEVAAAVVEEPWLGRLLAAGGAEVLADFRQPETSARVLGGPFHEAASVVRAADGGPPPAAPAPAGGPDPAARQAALAAYARALLRTLAWLAATPPEAVADRLPPGLAGERERFVARLGAARAAYAPGGEAAEAGLETTLAVLRGGTPWPVGLRVRPADLREPAFVTAARAALGPSPPPP
jgi:NitT/TauT family transport system substrate-binding protein